MSWPDIKLQPPGSMECAVYAISYLSLILGEYKPPEDIQPLNFRESHSILDTRPEWNLYGGGRVAGGVMFSFSPGFRDWCTAYTKHGCVGYAHVYMREEYGHSVVLLEADEEGVLLGDPARGLVRDPWESFESYVGDPTPGGRPSSVKAWYRLP